jgi:hypothetical protein
VPQPLVFGLPLNFERFGVPRFLQITALAGWLLLPWMAVGQNADPHISSDPAHVLYARSAFAHGYIHGYEQGFHLGNLEVQMGHGARPLEQYKAYRNVPGYRSEDGDHNSFRRGYREGFRAAYDDAVSGGVFRAIGQVRQAAEGLAEEAKAANREFDRALADGYETGWTHGVQHERLSSGFQYAAENCLAGHNSASYCDAFSRGFGLGYENGSVLQDTHATQTAQMRKK